MTALMTLSDSAIRHTPPDVRRRVVNRAWKTPDPSGPGDPLFTQLARARGSSTWSRVGRRPLTAAPESSELSLSSQAFHPVLRRSTQFSGVPPSSQAYHPVLSRLAPDVSRTPGSLPTFLAAVLGRGSLPAAHPW